MGVDVCVARKVLRITHGFANLLPPSTGTVAI